MKPFNLESAKRGEPIVTRDGRKAKFVAHIPEAELPYRVLAFIEGNDRASSYYDYGAHAKQAQTSLDLFMAPRKRTVYMNIYPNGDGIWYDSKDVAVKYSVKKTAIAIAVPVEFEE